MGSRGYGRLGVDGDISLSPEEFAGEFEWRC